MSDTERNRAAADVFLDEFCKGHCADRIAALESQLAEARADVVAAAGELMVPIPEPGTDMSKVMIANALMRRERDKARAEVERYKVDAERYRWLRNCTFDKFSGDVDDRLYVACDDAVYANKWALHSEELDEAVDAARSQP